MTKNNLEQTLSSLRVGHRAWFWWCAEANPPLLLSSLLTDPGAASLRTQIAAAEAAIPAWAPRSSGIASVGPDGTLTLGGEGLSAAALWQLAGWARERLESQPRLARLRGTRMVELDDGYIIATHSDDSLWEGFPQVSSGGSIQQAAERLEKLSPGRDAWFWATDSGPGQQPGFALGPAWRDQDGSAFAAQVSELRRQSPTLGGQVEGVLRKSSDGVIVLTAARSVNESLKVLLSLLDTPLAALLDGATVAELRDGVICEAATLTRSARDDDSADLSQQEEALRAIRSGSQLAFWFTAADADGYPLLLLADSSAELKPKVLDRRGSGRSVRGIVEPTPRGWLHFQIKQPYPDLILSLAEWTSHHIRHHPGLGRLCGARLTQYGPDGDIAERQRADDRWPATTT
jgi:hypothetical protein